jgi:uncharacterized protein (TIGR03067 family)
MSRVCALVLGVGLLAVSTAGADDAKKADKLDLAKLVGTWKLTSGMKAGQKVGADGLKGLVIFGKKQITLKGQTPDEQFEIKYTVNASASSATIDMEIVKPEPFKGTKSKGIIKLENGVLTLCYIPMGDKRPAKFESTAENNAHLFTMKKVETSGKKAEK